MILNIREPHEQKFEVLNSLKALRELPLHPETVEYSTPKGHKIISPQENARDLGVYVSKRPILESSH